MIELETIQGFQSPSEFRRFVAFIEAGIAAGELREISSDPNYHAGEICGGRWFELVKDHTVWRLIEPDFPFTGLFEQVVQNSR